MSGFARVAVVGAGLVGGSVALRLRELGLDVVVVDPDPATVEAAADAGLVVGDTVPADRDLVVLATPLDALPAALAEVAAVAPRRGRRRRRQHQGRPDAGRHRPRRPLRRRAPDGR